MSEIIYDGWTVNKGKVAYYAFGDQSKSGDVVDFTVEDAVTQLKTILNRYKQNLYERVDKTDVTLNLAIVYLTACQIVRSGNASVTSGNITGERINDMSVNYAQIQQAKQIQAIIPQDPCERAQDLIKQYLKTKFGISSKYQIVTRNPDDKRFNGTYNKRTQSYNWLEDY